MNNLSYGCMGNIFLATAMKFLGNCCIAVARSGYMSPWVCNATVCICHMPEFHWLVKKLPLTFLDHAFQLSAHVAENQILIEHCLALPLRIMTHEQLYSRGDNVMISQKWHCRREKNVIARVSVSSNLFAFLLYNYILCAHLPQRTYWQIPLGFSCCSSRKFQWS